jgi:hypothetical protein
MISNGTTSAFDQLFVRQAEPTIEERMVGLKHAFRAGNFDRAVHPAMFFYAELGLAEAAGHSALLRLPFHLEAALASTALASVTTTLLAEIRHFVIHTRPFSLKRFAGFLLSLPELFRRGFANLVADLGVAALGVGTWHLIENVAATYVGSWVSVVESLRRSGLSVSRAVYALVCLDGSIRERAHASLIELAGALSSGVSAGLDVILNMLFSAPLLAALTGFQRWLNAIITGTLFAGLVAALQLTDATGAIRERRWALAIAEANRALVAAEKSAHVANDAIERSRCFYLALGVSYTVDRPYIPQAPSGAV